MKKRFPALLATVFLLMSCSGPGQQAPRVSATGVITGTINYRERIQLPPGATVVVSLQDISRADAPADEIATLALKSPGSPPVPFELSYPTSAVLEGRSYSVRAEIRADDRLLFTTDTVYPVLTRGHGSEADLMLVSVQPQTPPDAELLETRWLLQKIENQPIAAREDGREPFLVLRSFNNAVEGSTGCNQIAGTYSLQDDRIDLGALAMTMMACVDGMDAEQAYTRALDRMNRYAISGQTLYGYDGNSLVLEFSAGGKADAQL